MREVRSIAVFLDDMGILATALDELVRGNILKEDRFPWLVSLHDLAVMSEVIDRPAEFLLYLRRRTESDISLNYSAVDELDLFMLFFQGQLYIEPDPERMYKEFIGAPRPTNADRKRYRENAVPTVVGTHTDPLDAWVYHSQGMTRTAVEKPVFQSHPAVLSIVDFLTDGHKPGWLRFSADLLNLNEEAQASFAEHLEIILASTAKDSKAHWFFSAYAGSWGYPVLAVSTRGQMESLGSARERFKHYAITKKHQLKSDRILMMIISNQGGIEWIGYDHTLPMDNPELDRRGREMGLDPVNTPTPPSSRRATKRLRRGRGRRH